MKNDAVLRAGLIGCGFFAQNHLHSWSEIEGVKLVAVCDREIEKARSAAAKFNVAKAYEDAAEMLERERSTSSTS
jgi:predicted dehydrogenase